MTNRTANQPAADLPLTTTPRGTAERRMLGALTVAAGAALLLSACGSIGEAVAENRAGHTTTYEFATGKAGKAEAVLPDWVPDSATDVREVVRTTGDERILTMTADPGALPASCTPVSADHPLEPRPEHGELDAIDYRTAATLEASWWEEGTEQSATVMCGKWWVGSHDGALFGFTPELKVVEVEDQPDPA
ncbi:hypothetical protein NSA53_06435 [Cellulosimicrobium cellulans]|uniref:hypothetical protein n=1 Tax=Cellulosimicrobium cellulans TaxID=1710 RepID=UPI002149E8BA|nr:hypothetical protein [Cellulosimicrobium cellulans]